MVLFPLVAPLLVVGLATTPTTSDNEDAVHRYLKPFSLELHDFPQTGRGVRTLVDRSPGEVLIQIPVQDSITVSSSPSATAVKALQNNQKKAALSEELLLSLTLALLRKEKHPYVSTVLPQQHFGVWTMPAALFQGLCLPRCYREFFQATRNAVLDFMSMDLLKDNDDESMEITSSDLQWGFSMVRSRSMAVPELPNDDIALIPGLDMFNHAFDAGTSLQLMDNAHWSLISSKKYSAGDQIFLSYGEDKDNWKLLQTYGFSVKENQNAFLFWTWEDLLDAASQLRPNLFTERVCQSLLRHPQLTAYSALTENRAIFSFDANQGLPRDSLQTGLTLMISLASQLGFPNDEKLPGEVLNQLFRNRLKDLEECRKGQSKLDVEIPEEWKPFWDSTLQILDDEESYLKAVTQDSPAEL